MKKSLSIAFIFVALLVSVFWVLLYSDFEIGRYEDLQEAIEKGIPYKVNDIIHTEEYDNITIVMYTTNPDKDELPFANYEALAVDFFIGSDEEGWENIGPHGWEHYENNNLTVYREFLRVHDSHGNTLHNFSMLFGEINNAEIITVETKTKEEEKFEEAKLVTAEGKRYYFKIGEDTIVRGLSQSGEVIDRQGG